MSLAERWARTADRHRKGILAACAALALLGGVGTARLYGDLRPDMSELLPESSRSAVDLATVSGRVGGFAELTVVLHGADRGTLEIFADDLADRLASAPPDLVRWVEYRLDAVQDFYRRRLLLFASPEELASIRDTLRARVEWDRAAARGGASGPAPDVDALLSRLASEHGDLIARFPDGYFVGEVPGRKPGEKIPALAMLVRLAGSPDDYERVVALKQLVEREVAALEPARYAPGLKVAYGGHVASNILEHDALAEDLVLATLLVLFSVALAVALYNRTWKAVPAVGLPLVAGALVTFGLAELVVGHLNSNTAFLGSIVVGNGINVGLILFARYLEERRHGRSPQDAMTTALSATWLATLTAALAAGAAYASLLSTDFRGFNQFGLIGGVGMALSWISAYVVTPPLVLAWERVSPIPKAGQRPAHPIFTQAVSRLVEGAPRVTALAAVALTAASLFFIGRFARDPIEQDFRKLRDQSALAPGGPSWWDERVDALFGGHLTPTVLLANDEAEAREVAARLEAHRARTPGTTLGPVLSVGSLVPARQAEKLPVVREIAALATPENLSFLPPDRRMAVQAALPPADLGPFEAKDLPWEVRRQLTELDGRVGTPVLVYPAAKVDVWNGLDVQRFEEELRAIEMPRAGVPMASSLLVFADVLHAISADGPRATYLALAGVVTLVLVGFGLGKRTVRSLSDAGWVLASLAVGVTWFAGLAGALHLRLNMLNFIALPITFGIGVDYATNIFQRRRIDHARAIADVVRTTGGAVALCSLTTIIGYSSLLVARNQALISFGVLADLGEVACLAAALVALPAVLRWRELRATAAAPPATGGAIDVRGA
jgi:predicted RND superfamily exporter protein